MAKRVLQEIYRVRTLDGVCMGPVVKPCATNGFRAFQMAKLSPQDTQLNTISGIFLSQIKLNTEKKPVLSGHSNWFSIPIIA